MLQWMQISLRDSDFISFVLYLGVGLLDHMVVLFLMFWGTSILFSIVVAPIYFLVHKGSFFSTSLPTLVIFWLDDSPSARWYLIVALICTSLVISSTVRLFMYLLAFVCLLLERCLSSSFAHFLIGLLVSFWILSCMSFLYVLHISPISDIWLAHVFLPIF